MIWNYKVQIIRRTQQCNMCSCHGWHHLRPAQEPSAQETGERKGGANRRSLNLFLVDKFSCLNKGD
jgi:hypothetical protein